MEPSKGSQRTKIENQELHMLAPKDFQDSKQQIPTEPCQIDIFLKLTLFISRDDIWLH
jgi:hypothetical protein